MSDMSPLFAAHLLERSEGMLKEFYGDPTSVSGDPAVQWGLIKRRCTEIADKAVPEYRDGKRRYSCHGHTAKRWQAAWDGACIALGGDPAEYRG